MGKEEPTRISIAEIPENVTIYICGDRENKSCGLQGESVALGCNGCMYKAGTIGRNCIKDGAKIIFNKHLNLW